MQSSGKSKVEVGDVLAALFDEDDSYAVYFLKSHGVARLDILEYISHGMPKEAGVGGRTAADSRREKKGKRQNR